MIGPGFRITLASTPALLVSLLLLAACTSETVTPTPTITSTPSPSPTLAPLPTSTPVPTVTTPSPVQTDTPTPTAPHSDEPAEVVVNLTEATVDFPNSITFSLDASSPVAITDISLEYGTDLVFSCDRSYATVEQEFAEGTQVSASWAWEFKKTGSIPPGSIIWWRWRVTDEAGRTAVTPRSEVTYVDQRFDWQTVTQDNITFHWYDRGPNFGREVTDLVDAGLSLLELNIPSEKPIQAFIYSTGEDVRGALLFAQVWTGGRAFPSSNIVLIAISPGNLQEEITGLTHELAHLLVRELTFNCLGWLPAWLDEGLAMYSEGPLETYQRNALEQAIQDDEVISVRSLSSSFPADHSGAILSYAQSFSLVEYLIDTHGWEKMADLLAIFKEGSAPDKALQEVYGLDRDSLYQVWRQYVGVN